MNIDVDGLVADMKATNEPIRIMVVNEPIKSFAINPTKKPLLLVLTALPHLQNDLIEVATKLMQGNEPMNGAEMIAQERQRQVNEEGYTPEVDDRHTEGEMADAASFYSLTDSAIDHFDTFWGNDQHLSLWPWDLDWLKPTPEDRKKQLVKAGALIAAEIDRLIRIERKEGE